jgi:hypothetical protein
MEKPLLTKEGRDFAVRLLEMTSDLQNLLGAGMNRPNYAVSEDGNTMLKNGEVIDDADVFRDLITMSTANVLEPFRAIERVLRSH